VSDGSKYVTKPKKQIIKELIENKRSILQMYFDEHQNTYGKRILMRFERYMDRLYDNVEDQKDLEIDIISMLVNISNVIGSDEWTQKLINDLRPPQNDT
jgi:hypothetical protein